MHEQINRSDFSKSGRIAFNNKTELLCVDELINPFSWPRRVNVNWHESIFLSKVLYLWTGSLYDLEQLYSLMK